MSMLQHWHEKDVELNEIAKVYNVAQFVSFGPDGSRRFACISGMPEQSSDPREWVRALLSASPEGSVNIRTFTPAKPRGNPFIYGITSVDEVLAGLRRHWDMGLFTIVNETIAVNDGGVSGVAHSDLLEFAPGVTPRGVEDAHCATLPATKALSILETVYGFRIGLVTGATERLEFSIHPERRGTRRDHVIIWEREVAAAPPQQTILNWPNAFSRMIGDKAYGLVVANTWGLPVPLTNVIARDVRPFSFGSDTGSEEVWVRTCPREPAPGVFTTRRGWTDPFDLLHREDSEHRTIASVLVQRSIPARYSGAAMTSRYGEPVVQGAVGFGDDFMLGGGVAPLPLDIVKDLRAVWSLATDMLGPVEFEWVHDGTKVWIVQLHRRQSSGDEVVIYPGEPHRWLDFNVTEVSTKDRLRVLSAFVARAKEEGAGIQVVGRVGVTSHIGQTLRDERIPSRMVYGGAETENRGVQTFLSLDSSEGI